MPNLLNKISDLSKRIFVNRVASDSLRIKIERQFSRELQRGLVRLDQAVSARLLSTGILRTMQRQSSLIARLPYKQRRTAISDTLNSVLNPGTFRDLKYSEEVRRLATIYRKYAPLMYDMGAVTALRSFGVRSKSLRLEDFSRRYTASKAPTDLVFELTDEEVIWMLDNRGIQFGQGITEQTIRDARAIIREEVYIKGNSYQVAADRIAKMNGVTPARSLKIARTEAQVAHSTATHDQYVRSGVKTHQWWAVGDRRTRPAHALNDGVTVKIGEVFPSGQLHPGDGAQAINCRCTVTPDLSDKNIQLDPWRGGPGSTPTALPDATGFVPRTITPAERRALRGTHKPKPRPKRKPKKKPKAAPQEAAAVKEAQDFEKLRTEILADFEKDPTYLAYVKAQEKVAAANAALENSAAYKQANEIAEKLAKFRRPNGSLRDTAESIALRKELGPIRNEVIKLLAQVEEAGAEATRLAQQLSKKIRPRLKTSGKGIRVTTNSQTGGSDIRTAEYGKTTSVNVTKATQSKVDDAVAFIDDISSGEGLLTEEMQRKAFSKLDDVNDAIQKVDGALSSGGGSAAQRRDFTAYLKMLKDEQLQLMKIIDGEVGTHVNVLQLNKTVRAHQSSLKVAGGSGKSEIDYILLHKSSPVDTVIHEIGHALEDAYHSRSARAYFKHRASPNANKYVDVLFKNGEIYHPDEFIHYYQGRIYLDPSRRVRGQFLAGDGTVRGTEIHSMYLEKLYSDPLLLMQRDPEGFVYIMESMNGVPLEQQTWFKLLPKERQNWLLAHDDFATAPGIPGL